MEVKRKHEKEDKRHRSMLVRIKGRRPNKKTCTVIRKSSYKKRAGIKAKGRSKNIVRHRNKTRKISDWNKLYGGKKWKPWVYIFQYFPTFISFQSQAVSQYFHLLSHSNQQRLLQFLAVLVVAKPRVEMKKPRHLLHLVVSVHCFRY